ncbi:cyclic nucleotide-binding domain-containing protein [Streptomyces bluensis]|uniref:Cyclic nucleotide-binding domain-containing protein n=1 Tax=Streptomyces bluensis TaxID=33897 RepID=A0ABW6UUY8_9ACTN
MAKGGPIVVARTGVFGALTKEHREQFMSLAREVSFAIDERIFDEGGRADRFWIIHTGTVALDLHVPGRRAAVIETVGAGELLGWSWLVPPHRWHLGAQASSPVRAYEFDATAVRELCGKDPELDHALLTYVSGVIAGRLRSARVRLLDLYAPHGAGEVP